MHIHIYIELGGCFHFLLLWIMLLCTSAHIYSVSVSTLWGIFPRSGIVGSYGRMPHFMLLFWNFFLSHLFPPGGIIPSWTGSLGFLKHLWLETLPRKRVKLEAHTLCFHPLPAIIEHATLPSLFPSRSVVRVGSFPPDLQLHSTAHTGVTVLSCTLEFWAGHPHPGEYQNHQLWVDVSCPSNTEDPTSRF